MIEKYILKSYDQIIMSYKEFYDAVEVRELEDQGFDSPDIINRYAWSIRTSRTIKLVSEIIKSTKSLLFLVDVGCAGMWQHILLLENSVSHKYIGCDISFSCLQKLKDTPSSCRVVCDAANLPFKDNTIQLVTSFETIEHLPDPRRAVSEIQRISKEFIAVSVPMIGVAVLQQTERRFNKFAEQTERKIRDFIERVDWEKALPILAERTGAAHVNVYTFSRFTSLFSSKHKMLHFRGALFYIPKLRQILANRVMRVFYLFLERALFSHLLIFITSISWFPIKHFGNRYGIVTFSRNPRAAK